MNLEQRTSETVSRLHRGNSRVMMPVTVSAVIGIIVYITIVFQGLRGPSSPFHFQVFVKIIICFLVIGAPNIVIFEMWVRKTLLSACRVLAWDGTPGEMSDREAVQSIESLLDFPHKFTFRFIIHWIVAAPLIVTALRIFYAIPPMELVFLGVGSCSILCIMSVFHYFLIKRVYSERLNEALPKFPSYYQRPELAEKRIRYRTKVLVFILVLVGAMTWVTTHLSISGRSRSVDLQRDQFLGKRIKQEGEFLESSLRRGDTKLMIKNAVNFILGGNVENAYILDREGNELQGKNIPPGHKEIIESIRTEPGFSFTSFSALFSAEYWKETASALFSLEYWTRNFFDLNKILLVRATDRVMHVYTGKGQATVTVDFIGDRWRLVTIQPLAGATAQAALLIMMVGVALALSFLFAHFMQGEIMSPLSKLIDSSRRVASGDLSDPPTVMADDELGELAVHHLRMVSSIKSMVEQIQNAARAVDSSSHEIVEKTEQMLKGSEDQSVAVEETTAAITQMNQTMGNIGESVQTLATSAEQSSASILEMSTTNEQVAASSEELSLAVVETTASIQQMSASIKEVAHNVQNTSGKAGEAASAMDSMRDALKKVDKIAAESAIVSQEVARDSESGAKAVQSTIDGIGQIWEVSREAADVIESLSKRAREIGRILTVIEEVTEETNLLALNAAIIAAQAGEHGRGFAVVADEIKDLAERTQASTSEIADQIKNVQDDAKNAVSAVEKAEEMVSKGVLLSEEAGEALNKIQQSSKKSLELATKISSSTVDQYREAEKIHSFFENIVGMIEQISAATQEQTRGSEQIILAAERMRDIAAQVKRATKEQSMGGKQITQAIEHVTQIANYINASQSEQSKAAHQVLEAMTRISDIATRNVQSVETVSRTVSDLKMLADDLKAMLDIFCMENAERKQPDPDRRAREIED